MNSLHAPRCPTLRILQFDWLRSDQELLVLEWNLVTSALTLRIREHTSLRDTRLNASFVKLLVSEISIVII